MRHPKLVKQVSPGIWEDVRGALWAMAPLGWALVQAAPKKAQGKS